METISTTLLDELELYLNDRIDMTLDGKPNKAMTLLMQLQAARHDAPDHRIVIALDHNGDPLG